MPIYKAMCDCGHTQDVYLPLREMDNLPHHCGKRMFRAVCAPMVIADIQPYRSMATGEMIGGRAQHREHLKKHGLVEVGNEKIPVKPQPTKSSDIKADLYKVANGMGL